MSGSFFTLNQKYNNLKTQTNGGGGGGVPTSSTLADVLLNGNSAGATDINMNNKNITAVNNINLVTINGSAYPPVVSAVNLQQVLNTGNTATGANAKIGLTNTDVGYTSSPQLTLNNSRSDAGASVGVPSIEYFKSGRNAVAGDVIGATFYNAKNSTGIKTEFAKIEASVRNTGTSPNNDDGSIGFSGLINGVQTEFFRVNGADSENNMFLPLDMNGQSIKSSSGNLSLSSSASTGGGVVVMTSKTQSPSSQYDFSFLNSATNILSHSLSAGWDFFGRVITTSTGNLSLNASSSTGTGQITIRPKTGTNLTIATTPTGVNKTTINPDGTNMSMTNTTSTFVSTVQSVNNALANTFLFLQQDYGGALQKNIYLLCSSSAGNSLESTNRHTPAVPFKIKTDNASFSNSNSSLEIDMNPVNDANVLAQLTFTHDNTLLATAFTPNQYIPVLIAGTQYYIPITLTPT
jgi:hypothetical protein